METLESDKKESSKEYHQTIERLEITTLDGQVYEYVPVTEKECIEILEANLNHEAENLESDVNGRDYSSLSVKEFFNLSLTEMPKEDLNKLTKMFERTYGTLNLLNRGIQGKSAYFTGTNCGKVLRLNADLLKWSEFWDKQEHYRVYRKDGKNNPERKEIYKWDVGGELKKKYVETSYEEFNRALDNIFQEASLEGNQAYLSMEKTLLRLSSINPEFNYVGELAENSSFKELMSAILLLNKSADVFSEYKDEIKEINQYSCDLIDFLDKALAYAQCSDAKMVEDMIYFLSDDGDVYFSTSPAYEELRDDPSEFLTTKPKIQEQQGESKPDYYR